MYFVSFARRWRRRERIRYWVRERSDCRMQSLRLRFGFEAGSVERERSSIMEIWKV